MPVPESKVRKEIVSELQGVRSHSLSISDLIDRLYKRLVLDASDTSILKNRSDEKFTQKVRNTVSHRANKTSLENQGLAIYNPVSESWTLTPKGVSTKISSVK